MELSYSLWNPHHLSRRIVLLHGMGGTGALWRPVAASLEDHFAVLAPDQRGHGRSRVSAVPGGREAPGYTPLDYGRDVIETLEKLQFHPAWLIGHSMGVRSACAAAHLRPEWCNGLILVDLGFSGQAGGGLGDNLANFLRILPMQFPSRAEARAFMESHCPDPSIAQYLMAVSIRVPATESHPEYLTFPFDRAALIQTIQAARDSSVGKWIEELAGNGMPILVLRGAQSLVWSREEFLAEKTKMALLPTIEFREIEGTGHGLPFERRTEFVQAVQDFISSGPD